MQNAQEVIRDLYLIPDTPQRCRFAPCVSICQQDCDLLGFDRGGEIYVNKKSPRDLTFADAQRIASVAFAEDAIELRVMGIERNYADLEKDHRDRMLRAAKRF